MVSVLTLVLISKTNNKKARVFNMITFYYPSDEYGCFSQFYLASFRRGDFVYYSSEQYMMLHKALLFGDELTAQEIRLCKTPALAKKLGRKVVGFDQEIWDKNKFNIVLKGNILKFSQNPELEKILISTNNEFLVEASPTDKVWGSGLNAEYTRLLPIDKWPGKNMLGQVLMGVRAIFS